MRIINRPLAFILAVVLAAAGVIVVVEVIAHAVNAKPVIVHWHSWYDFARRTRWKTGVVRFWAAVLIIVGLLLIIVELTPARISRLRVNSDQPATDASITRAGLSQALRRAATGVNGVDDAAVRTGRNRVTVTARTGGHPNEAADPLKGPVTAAVQARLDGLRLVNPPRLTVRMAVRS